MPSSIESSNSVDSPLTHTASGSASQSSDGPSYDWVDPSVLQIPTKIGIADDLDEFFYVNKNFLASECPTEALAVDVCGVTDRVCHGRENASHDFFFVYSTFFSHLHITFPFDDFTMRVLQILNVAPTQLHPNSWAILQAFRILCQIFGLKPTPESFLYYYHTHPSTHVGWLSLSSQPENLRFAAFTTSYKNFKEYYFKVFVEPDGRDLFYKADGTTKFLFHWTEKPTPLDNRFWKSLTPFDKEILLIVNQLPCRLPTRELVALYGSFKQWADLNDIILKMDPSLSKFMKSLKRQADSRKISTVAGIKSKSPTVVAEEVPTETVVAAPAVSKKRGRSSKAQRSKSESTLQQHNPHLKLAPHTNTNNA